MIPYLTLTYDLMTTEMMIKGVRLDPKLHGAATEGPNHANIPDKLDLKCIHPKSKTLNLKTRTPTLQTGQTTSWLRSRRHPRTMAGFRVFSAGVLRTVMLCVCVCWLQVFLYALLQQRCSTIRLIINAGGQSQNTTSCLGVLFGTEQANRAAPHMDS